VREECIELMGRVIDGSKLKVPKDLRAELPYLLWLHLMGIVLFWIHDESPGGGAATGWRSARPPSWPGSWPWPATRFLRPLRRTVLDLLARSARRHGGRRAGRGLILGRRRDGARPARSWQRVVSDDRSARRRQSDRFGAPSSTRRSIFGARQLPQRGPVRHAIRGAGRHRVRAPLDRTPDAHELGFEHVGRHPDRGVPWPPRSTKDRCGSHIGIGQRSRLREVARFRVLERRSHAVPHQHVDGRFGLRTPRACRRDTCRAAARPSAAGARRTSSKPGDEIEPTTNSMPTGSNGFGGSDFDGSPPRTHDDRPRRS
jgi:hypothetical protein